MRPAEVMSEERTSGQGQLGGQGVVSGSWRKGWSVGSRGASSKRGGQRNLRMAKGWPGGGWLKCPPHSRTCGQRGQAPPWDCRDPSRSLRGSTAPWETRIRGSCTTPSRRPYRRDPDRHAYSLIGIFRGPLLRGPLNISFYVLIKPSLIQQQVYIDKSN